ncbi:MAG: Unknown protein [uncultured Sulfurovum sp.]|uniref:Putative restriction endonuclease domain-containing protein n=1 Tax=uncultured Sulfurovum sp. TaxID=269237 RepID=A0A6S6SGG2_9BACT|nr:MAG: Unknown protein [uncultured Sulfurovum sp.]
MLTQNYIELYTLDDYRHWEDNWELIYGSPYAMAPSPLVTHQNINGKIFLELNKSFENCPKCQALFEIDWEISSDTVVKPDMLVICYEADEKITKKPEIIFEIASKSTVKRDETLKYELYQQEGVEFYIIVYPEKQVAKVYQLKEGRYLKVQDFSDELYAFNLEKCKIDFDFSKIWRKK